MVDVSEEAVRARMQDLTDGAKNMTINDDLEKAKKNEWIYSMYWLNQNVRRVS